MKKLNTLLFFVLLSLCTYAQLPDGSIAPDFTATDINGKTWNLYELLDQGKTVVIDVSATWCGPCWAYHNTGALEELYKQYGPDGTNEMMVLFIEGDTTTNVDCIYNLPTCNSSSQGDWAGTTPYPIIDAAYVAEAFQITYYPTIYHICSNRIVREVNQLPTDDIYAMNSNCMVAFGANNAALLQYTGFSGLFCESKTFKASGILQNLGSTPLTSAKAELYINNTLKQTINWTGNLVTYQMDNLEFAAETVSADASIEIRVTEANGVADEDASNNNLSASATLSTAVSDQNLLKLEIKTDKYPTETYWELRDANGTAFYSGGNDRVVGGVDGSGTYTDPNTVYTVDIPLPADGCYEFAIYDNYGDGICCIEGNGYYKIIDPNGNVVMQGGEFGDGETIPLSIKGAGTVQNNAAIVWNNSEAGEFCGEYTYKPIVSLQNLGANDITSATIKIATPTTTYLNQQWTGKITPGQVGFLNLNAITFTETANPLEISISDINGQPDVYSFKNSAFTGFSRLYTEQSELTMELQLDKYAYEVYWQLTNSAGTVLASGGNEVVGPNGGGLRVATPGDSGAYPDNELVSQTLSLPGNVNDCYEFMLVDDYGDGLVDGGGGYLRISDTDGNVIYNGDLTTLRFTSDKTSLDVHPVVSAAPELTAVRNLDVFPNPASDEVNVRFQLPKAAPLQVSLYNAYGQLVQTLADRDFAAGHNQLKANLSTLSGGLYYVRLSNGEGELVKKFTVLNR